MKEKLELRMYGLVPYNISPIQQAIQFGHAVVEYSNHVIFGSFDQSTIELYKDWAFNWKTFIILNGGTTNYNKVNGKPSGSLNKHLNLLLEKNIPAIEFREPDLQDAVTAVVFVVDERAFKRRPYSDDPNEKFYPDFYDYIISKHGSQIEKLKLKDGTKLSWEDSYSEDYKEWFNLIGGETNLFLREFLKQFKLA